MIRFLSIVLVANFCFITSIQAQIFRNQINKSLTDDKRSEKVSTKSETTSIQQVSQEPSKVYSHVFNPAKIALSPSERYIINEVNKLRESLDLHMLVVSPFLMSTSRVQTRRMANNHGIVPHSSELTFENNFATSNPLHVMEFCKNSPECYQNMINPSIRYIGVGCYNGYASQQFTSSDKTTPYQLVTEEDIALNQNKAIETTVATIEAEAAMEEAEEEQETKTVSQEGEVVFVNFGSLDGIFEKVTNSSVKSFIVNPAKVALTYDEKYIISEINKSRYYHGLPMLIVLPSLMNSARKQTVAMALKDELTHNLVSKHTGSALIARNHLGIQYSLNQIGAGRYAESIILDKNIHFIGTGCSTDYTTVYFSTSAQKDNVHYSLIFETNSKDKNVVDSEQ